MQEERIEKQYQLWCEKAKRDQDLNIELLAMQTEPEKKYDAFYKELSFGTGGLRGLLGAGTNRMNVYTVAKASQGLADFICREYKEEDRSIAVAYDSRIKSDLFANVAAEVFAANRIKVYIYPELMPTPCLSFAVRELGCAAGVMITASHNPAEYNGYKVYGSDGCQITTETAKKILSEINKLDLFMDIRSIAFERAKDEGKISYIEEGILTDFLHEVKKQSLLDETEMIDKTARIIYTPLHGTGRKPILRLLEECGYKNVIVVREQEEPDGDFPGCPYPNPEVRAAMEPGVEYAKEYNADLLLATDPDCDRVGIAVKQGKEHRLLSGNETGLLLFDYICARRIETGRMPKEPVLIKTIVTTDLAERIAASYGVRTVNVLTGFKFIGEQIGMLEKEGKETSYLFGFEESYGYLSGTYVRDKDGVNAVFLICEMFGYYRSRGISLIQRLNKIYQRFGYCLNTLHTYKFEGAAGLEKMQMIMYRLRQGIERIGDRKIEEIFDYAAGIDGLPKADVLKFVLEENVSLVVRPSGTEPTLKLYLSAGAKEKADAVREEASLVKWLEENFLCR